MLHVGAEAADAGEDRLAVLRVLADFARQREQPERAARASMSSGDMPLGRLARFGFSLDP